MKLRHLALIGGFAAAAVGGWWTWQAIRHARLDLVTMHVRDALLADVLARIRRQTREELVVDRHFTGEPGVRVNLDLDAAPLVVALAAIAEQAGGFWRTTYAVHGQESSIRRLIDLLRTGTDPTRAGWTNLTGLAPAAFDLEANMSPDGGPVIRPFPGPPGGPSRRGVARGGEGEKIDVAHSGPGDPLAGSLGRGPMMNRRVIIRGAAPGTESGANSGILTFDASPERLLLEELLLPRASGRTSLAEVAPSPQDAERLARELRGHWSALYSLERSPIPGIHGELPPMIGREPTKEGSLAWKGATAQGDGPEGFRSLTELVAHAENEIRRRQFDRLERLTPEQRARQAAEFRSVEAIDAQSETSTTK